MRFPKSFPQAIPNPDPSTFVISKRQVEEILEARWRMLMSGGSESEMTFTKGMLHFAQLLGFLSEIEVEGWLRRIERCPDEGVHIGGRSWCAYCGTLKQVPDPDGSNEDGSPTYVGVPIGEMP